MASKKRPPPPTPRPAPQQTIRRATLSSGASAAHTARKPPHNKGQRTALPETASVASGPIDQISPHKKGSAGRPPFVPTDENRALVKTLSGLGLPQEQIVLLVRNPTTGEPIDLKTLRAHFRQEMDEGVAQVNSKVAESLYKKATGDGPQAVTAGIWWTKCRMGWKERVVAEVETKSGVLIATGSITPEEWIAAQAAINATRSQPGENDDQ